jgi:hypothetical protein
MVLGKAGSKGMQKLMEFVCEHCRKLETSSVYQVVSEAGGIVLLDMIVCHSCYLQAKNLGLDAKEIEPAVSVR